MKKLGHHLGLWGVVSISIGTMIGGGLFVLPGLAAAKTGPSLWLAYLIAGVLVLPAALTQSELCTGMPSSGGVYVFIERSMGPLAGTIAGVGALLSLTFKASFALIGLSWYVAVLFGLPAGSQGAGLTAISLGILAGLVVLNLLGVAKVGRIQVVLVVTSLTLLVLLLLAGVPAAEPRNFEPAFPKGLTGLLAAAAFVFVSYSGVNKIAAVAEEVRRPERNIPLGILISLAGITVLYVTTSIVLLGVVPWTVLAGDVTPMTTLAGALLPGPLARGAAIVAILALISVANAGVLTASRFPFAMARDGLLPAPLARIHPRLLTPMPAILFTAAIMFLTIVLLDVEKVVKLGSGFIIFMFSANSFALIVFRESGANWYRPTFRSPFYPFTQIFGIVGGLVLLGFLGGAALLGVAGISLLAAAWYFAWARRGVSRAGLLQQVFATAATPPAPAPAVDAPAGSAARVVVALFGKERSPEALLDIARALRPSDGDRVDVLLLQEYPEQTVLAELPPDDRTLSFRRRIEARADELGISVEFDNVVTHDLRAALYERAVDQACDWVIVARRSRRNASFVRSPLERLLVSLPCDVAQFRDAGFRTYRRILVHAEPGPHDALVVRAAAELARMNGAQLTFVEALPAGAGAERERAATGYLEGLCRLSGVPAETRLLRGDDRADAIVHASVDFDLLVIAADEQRPLTGLFLPSEYDRIASRAVSSVVQLRTPLERTHEKVETLHAPDAPVAILPLLPPGGARARLAATTKRALFADLAAAFAAPLGLPAETIEAAFWVRERMQNTAMGHGVAIPHASLTGAQRTLVGLFTLASPLDYQAESGREVDVCIATVGPPGDRPKHLKVLARASALLLGTNLLDALRAASSEQELRAALAAAELALDGRAPPREGLSPSRR